MGTVLSQEATLALQLIDPGSVLFALTLILFGSAFTLSFLIGTKTEVVRPLMGVLSVILFLLLGTVALEFSAAATPSYTIGELSDLSAMLSTHRWLLFQLPIGLTMMSLIILSVYREKIVDRHARIYRAAVTLAIAISFASLISIAFEAMI